MKKLSYIAAILVLAACSNKPKDKATELADLKKQQSEINAKVTKLEAEVGTKDSVKSTEVNEATIKTGKFTNYVQLQGRIDAQENVTAYPQSPGTITAIYVKVGQHVSRGQVLVQLDNSVLMQNIAQAEAQASLAQTVFQRQKNLWDQKIGTEVQYLQAKSNYEASQKQVSGLKQQANMFRITSPINGTIDQMDLKLGQVAQPGTTGIRIVNADVLKVKADVPESYVSSINQGDKVKVVVPDANDSLMATVTFAAKVIDASSRSFAVEIKLPERRTLRPNMTAIIKIANYTKSDAIVVPLNSIQKSESGDYVFVNEDNIAKKRLVTEGASYGDKVEIKTGLKVGDKLITDGSTEVEDGDKVKVSQSVN